MGSHCWPWLNRHGTLYGCCLEKENPELVNATPVYYLLIDWWLRNEGEVIQLETSEIADQSPHTTAARPQTGVESSSYPRKKICVYGSPSPRKIDELYGQQLKIQWSSSSTIVNHTQRPHQTWAAIARVIQSGNRLVQQIVNQFQRQ